MDRRRRTRLSKLLSLLLRHDPDRASLPLDRGGWVTIPDLLQGLAELGQPVTRYELRAVVTGGDKPRFEVEDDRIRARYGHSIDVDLGYEPREPPRVLYHGTASRNVERVLREGIAPMGRQKVHLSATPVTARQVGARHGRPVVLAVAAAEMAAEGAVFHELPGGTWLTDHVPARFVAALDGGSSLDR